MSDPNAGGVPAKTKTDWTVVADNALHYAAAGAVVATVAVFYWYGKLSQDLFVVTLSGAAAAVGLKISK